MDAPAAPPHPLERRPPALPACTPTPSARPSQYCHANLRIAHRDIKLGNVLLNTKYQIPILKLCDFGYSKAGHWEGWSVTPAWHAWDYADVWAPLPVVMTQPTAPASGACLPACCTPRREAQAVKLPSCRPTAATACRT